MGVTCSHIDLYLSRRSDIKICLDFKVILGESLTTQHSVLVMDVRIKKGAKTRIHKKAPRIKHWHFKGEKHDISTQDLRWRKT